MKQIYLKWYQFIINVHAIYTFKATMMHAHTYTHTQSKVRCCIGIPEYCLNKTTRFPSNFCSVANEQIARMLSALSERAP